MSTEQKEQPSKRPVPDDEEALKDLCLRLRTEKGMTMRQIRDETGLSLSKLDKLIGGVEASGGSSGKTETEQPQPQKASPKYLPIMLRQEDAAKLYALAIDEGYSTVEEFLEKSMLPWYRVKRNFEWKLQGKIEPIAFQKYIESAMTDQIKLNQLREDLSKELKAKPNNGDGLQLPGGPLA